MSKERVNKNTRIAYLVTNPERLSGSNRSLCELIINLPDEITPLLILPYAGAVEMICPVKVFYLLPKPLQFLFKTRLESRICRALQNILLFVACVVGLFALIKKIKPHIFHVNDLKATFVVAPVAKLFRIPIVAHVRGRLIFSYPVRYVFSVLADKIILVSGELKNFLSKKGAEKSKAIYNGVSPLSRTAVVPSWLGAMRSKGTIIVTCVASVVPFKGYHHLLEVVKQVNNQGFENKVHFVFVGEFVRGFSRYHTLLWSKLQEYRLRNVSFVGWTNEPASYYRGTDICVLASVDKETLSFRNRFLSINGNEGLPRTLLEAMQIGLPIVATDIGGVKEQVENGTNGFIVPQGDVASFTSALLKLVEDEKLRKEFGAKSKHIVQSKFDVKTYVNSVLDVYNSCLVDPISSNAGLSLANSQSDFPSKLSWNAN